MIRMVTVSTVILNWNSKDYIQQCIDSVMSQTYPSVEIIVVDNASKDGSVETLASHYGAKITLIQNDLNLGYAGGMNRGIAASTGEFLLLLNSDVFLQQDYIEQVVRRFSIDESRAIGVIGGKLYQYINGNKSYNIDHVGFYLKARMAVVNSHNCSQEEFVFGSSGACPAVRRETLTDIELRPGEWFDETYFAYNEDIDLWFRCQLRGWHVLFLPASEGWHIHSGSVGGKRRLFERSDELQFHALKNRYMTIAKDYPTALLVLMLPLLILVEIAVLLFFLLRRPKTLKNWRSAWAYVFHNRETILKSRNIIQSRRVVSAIYLLRFFKGL